MTEITNLAINLLPAFVMLVIFIWGMKRIYSALNYVVASGTEQPALVKVLSEPADVEEGKTSFSRTAGAIGALAMASFFSGLGVWVLLSVGTDADVSTKLAGISNYFLSGTALYAPYAVNRISNTISNFAKQENN